MDDSVTLTIPIEPKPKLRPRFHIRNERISTSTPLKTKAFESYVADYYSFNCGVKFEKEIPLNVQILFGMPIPESFSKKKKLACIVGDIRHVKKPDLDNLTKSVLDALNNVAWNDDAQIVSLNISKGYSKLPHIEIKITADIAGSVGNEDG